VANRREALLWSIALPGFGQFLNDRFYKGTVFVLFEFLINVQSNFNEVIILSFHGNIKKAVEKADYQWLMFYPCLYFFAMWDAFKDAGGGKEKYAYLPFIFSAYFVTVGCIYSSNLTIFGILFGPVWLPLLFVIPGLIVGLLTKKWLSKIN
jgi:hypothetical protein